MSNATPLPCRAGREKADEGSIARRVTSHIGLYRGFFENVAEAITKKDPSLLAVSPESAALTIEVLELAILSAKEGRTITL